MQVDFDAVITDHRGKPIEHNVGTPSEPKLVPLTLGGVACEALLAFNPQEKGSGSEKVSCFRVAMKLVNGGKHDISVEDVALIKTKVGEIYAPVVVGRAYDLLEQKAIGEK